MARLTIALALFVPNLQLAACQQYQLIQEYNASNIFEDFIFFSGPDPTGGFVQYAPFDTAASTGLIGNGSDLVYLGVDNTKVYPPSGLGRPSVRLESKMAFTEGIFVFDLTHMPVGCGVWPALWTAGLGDWPTDGEIHIIENVNEARVNNVALHATGDCSITEHTNQTGTWKSTDCNVVHDENQGCAAILNEPANYGAEFNANRGGVYTMEWTNSAVHIWFFPPTAVPRSLSANHEKAPDPESLGTPSVSFTGPCSDFFGEKFFNHTIIIDTTFCGGWAGGKFGSGASSCPTIEGISPIENCINFVAENPTAFEEAYWGIRSIRVYEKVTEASPYVHEDHAGGILLPPPVTRPFPATSETVLDPPYASVDILLLPADIPITLEDESTITSTILSTKTTTDFSAGSQVPPGSGTQSAVAPSIFINDLIDSAASPTAIPNVAISDIESLLAKTTVFVPEDISSWAGGAQALGNGIEEEETDPQTSLTTDPNYGETTSSMWEDDPYADQSEDPFDDAVDSRLGTSPYSTAVIAAGNGEFDNTFQDDYQYASNNPIPSETRVVDPTSLTLLIPSAPAEENQDPAANVPTVPPELLENPPPTSIWGSIDDEIQDQLLALAAALPVASVPVESDKATTVTGVQPPQPINNDETNQAVGGLLDLLGPDGKGQLLGLLGVHGTSSPGREEDASGSRENRKQHANEASTDSLLGPPDSISKTATLISAPDVGDVAQPISPLSPEEPSSVISNSPLTPIVDITDTSLVVKEILDMLDESTKDQLLGILYSTPGPVMQPIQESDGQEPPSAYNPFWLTRTDAPTPVVDDVPFTTASWQVLAKTFSDEIKAKLDQIIDNYHAIKSSIRKSYAQFYGNLSKMPKKQRRQFFGSYDRHLSRQFQNISDASDDDKQGFLEQQIYAICPNLDALPIAELVADLSTGTHTTLETAMKRFRARLEAYMATLHRCSTKVQDYVEALEAFFDQQNTGKPPTVNGTQQHVRRQTQGPPVVSGNPEFDAFLQHKHDGDFGKWRYAVLSTIQKDALHTFVLRALNCALQPFRRSKNPSLDHDVCIANVTAAWIPVEPWITKSTNVNISIVSLATAKAPSPPEPDTYSHVDGIKGLESLEGLLSALNFNPNAPGTRPSHHLIPLAASNKHYYDVIKPKWMTNLRDLAFKSSSYPEIPFPVIYVQWLKKSLQKNWRYMNKDTRQTVVTLANGALINKSLRPRAHGKENILTALIKNLFGSTSLSPGPPNGTTTPSQLKIVVPAAAVPGESGDDIGDLELVDSAETSDPEGLFEPIDNPSPVDLVNEADPEGDDNLPSLGSHEDINNLFNFAPEGFDDLPNSSEVAPPCAERPHPHMHNHPDVLAPEFDHVVDSVDSKAPAEYVGPPQTDSDADESTPPQLDDDQLPSDGIMDNAIPKSGLDYPYSNAGNDVGDQSTPRRPDEDAYEIDDFLHEFFPQEVEVPAHADENAAVGGRIKGTLDQ